MQAVKSGGVLLGVAVLLDSVLSLKCTGNLTDDIIGITLAVVLSYLTALIIRKVYKYTFGKAAVLPFILVAAVVTLFTFSDFAAKVMLGGTGLLLPFFSMLALALYLGVSEKKVLYKISAVTAVISAALFIIIFSFSVRFMSVKYLLSYKTTDGSVLKIFLPLYLSLSLAFLILAVIGNSVREMLCSASLFAGLFALVTVNALGIFGSELASTLSYPYATAISTAATGEIFSRLDGFFYLISFFCALIKTGAAVYVFKDTLSKIKP